MGKRPIPPIYCTHCVAPSLSAIPANLDRSGRCGGCRGADERDKTNWREARQRLEAIIDQYRGIGDYDVVIPVGGGKDSYFQTHFATRELGLKALLVTYHGNNYLPEAEDNLAAMRDVFGCDHVVIRPSVDTLRRMNRLGFFLQGDMNWHAHCGIFTVPIQTAVRYQTPLVLWGEHGFSDIGGMFKRGDEIEFSKRDRVEHALRGFDWFDFTDDGLKRRGRPELCEGLTDRDLAWGKYPSDAELIDCGVRGIYLGNFVPWDGMRNAEIAKTHGWREAQEPFDRTYRRVSNLDDMHENGVHDYLKFIKLGYGRATDHASKDVRGGRMTRSEAVEAVLRYDHVIPSDIQRWCQYAEVAVDKFANSLDQWRDPRVWWREDGRWWKWCVDGEARTYPELGDLL